MQTGRYTDGPQVEEEEPSSVGGQVKMTPARRAGELASTSPEPIEESPVGDSASSQAGQLVEATVRERHAGQLGELRTLLFSDCFEEMGESAVF